MQNYWIQLTNFSIHVWIFNLLFPFFFLLDIQYRQLLLRLPESQRGKVSMLPQCSLLAGQCHSRLNCFRLSTSAIRALPPPPSNSPSFYCPKIYNLCFAFAVFVLLSFTQTQYKVIVMLKKYNFSYWMTIALRMNCSYSSYMHNWVLVTIVANTNVIGFVYECFCVCGCVYCS